MAGNIENLYDNIFYKRLSYLFLCLWFYLSNYPGVGFAQVL